MKRIIKRTTREPLTIDEARVLFNQLQRRGVSCAEHRSVYGYATPELAQKANMRAVLEAYEGYTFAYAGTENVPLEGYKVLIIGFKSLPSTFEQNFPDFVVIGK